VCRVFNRPAFISVIEVRMRGGATQAMRWHC
jgi:hypothetical protein